MRNLAGCAFPDAMCQEELTDAGIIIEIAPEYMRDGMGEVKTCIVGNLHQWGFHRSWSYWVARGPGIPHQSAMMLYEKHKRDVRVNGSCMSPSPTEAVGGLGVNMYHVDSQVGLEALAQTIRTVFSCTLDII